MKRINRKMLVMIYFDGFDAVFFLITSQWCSMIDRNGLKSLTIWKTFLML